MYAVIMAGGSGTRFWPASRRHNPKQFIKMTGHSPLIMETCDRLSPISKDEEMIIVLGQGHLKEAERLFSGRKVSLVAEPVGRNTAPCIGLGAIAARQMGCGGPVAFLPADHYIGNLQAFLEGLRAAGTLARSGGIVTLGIVPSKPETGYGYIRRGPSHVDTDGLTAYEVSEFVEKPDPDKALQYLKTKNYYWNAGIFVATPETILNETKRLLPDLYAGLLRLEEAWGSESLGDELVKVYGGLEGISFDYGVMEKTLEKVYVLPCECGWSDMGSWSSLYELRSADYDASQNLAEGQTLLIDCEGSFVSSRGNRLVTCLGVKDLLVVDTPETLLVTELNRSQDIRKIVDQLRKSGKKELT